MVGSLLLEAYDVVFSVLHVSEVVYTQVLPNERKAGDGEEQS